MIWGLGFLLLGYASLGLTFGVGLGDIFSRYPKFPLPEEYRHPEIIFDIDSIKEDQNMEEKISNINKIESKKNT